MKEQELKTMLERKGYQLLNIRRCKKHDKIRFQDKDITIVLTLRDGFHLENLEAKHIHEMLR